MFFAPEILERIASRSEVIGVDEANFMGAESIKKTPAICARCGNPAKHTQRLRGRTT